MPISPELQQGIFNLIYFTWLHNGQAIAYFVGILISLYLQFKNPNRKNLLLFIAFILLLLQFEFVKHIITPLEEQTLQAVYEQGVQATRFTRLTQLFIQKFIPFGLYLAGWGSLFLAIFSSEKKPSDFDK